MIRTEAEYKRALEQLNADKAYLTQLKKSLEDANLSEEEVERAMQPALSFHHQLLEEVETYERMRRGQLETLESLSGLGRWLIGIRIHRGWSQKELADRLGVSEAQVSRDERNEYHNVTTEKAQRILGILGARFSMEIDEPFPGQGETEVTAA